MSNDQKSKDASASANPLAGPNGARPIPVAMLQFNGRMIDLPGKSGASSVSATEQGNRARHSISYLPWLRCFRVEYTPAGKSTPEAHMHVPESWCTYQIAEAQP